MSYFDDASLVMIPSGTKTSKVYSVKPIDGSGDLTFTRSNDTATRVASNGLIEKVRTNLVLNSATFVTQTITVTANPHTISFTGTGTIVATGVGSGTLVGTGASNRVSLSFTTTAGSLILTLTGTATLAQLETGDIATDYIATTTAAVSVGPVANVPRLDYLNSTCPKLLLEPQRSNLALFSEQFDNAGWNKAAASVTANNSVSPDGYTNADLITSSGAAGYVYPSNTNVFAAAAGATYSYSVYLKAGTASIISLLVSATATYTGVFNLSTGVATTSTANTTASMSSVGNGWYRCVIVCASVANSAYSELQIGRVASGLTFSAYGAQLEAGAYATSYIPTLGASVTRGADAASKTGISSLIGQTEGTLFVDFTLNKLADYGTPISVNDGTTTKYVWLTIFASGILRAELYDGAVQASISYSGAVAGGRYKMAFGYKTNDFALYVNGALVGTDLTGATFSGTTMSRVDTNLTNAALYSTASESINQALLFKTRLTNAQLAELTTI